MRFGLLGYPIGHSLSPRLFDAAYAGRYGYDLIERQSFDDGFNEFIRGPYYAVNVTAPFKHEACVAADFRSPEVLKTGAANILLKCGDGIRAFNSDYLGVRKLLEEYNCSGSLRTAAVIGQGGAGRAAYAAAQDTGLDSKAFHHDGIAGGVEADIIIYTLPCAVEGIDRLECGILLEANYRNPCLEGHPGYHGGKEWLAAQAICGFCTMTGEMPDVEAIKKCI